MAPRKRKAETEEAAVAPVNATVTTRRMTRMMTRRTNSNSTELPPVKNSTEEPKKKKVKKAPKKEEKTEETAEAKQEAAKERTKKHEKEEVKEEEAAADGAKKTIVIEHCKQCNSFKTRAVLVKNGLEKAVPSITVLVNPDKPRRGCFEIREEAGETFISLLDMKRPFKPMKDLDMDKVISDIIEKIK